MYRQARFYIALGLFLVAYSIKPILSKDRGDFGIYLSASSTIWAGQSPYDIAYDVGPGKVPLSYSYHPAFSIFIGPLTALPEDISRVLWSGILILCILRIFLLLGTLSPVTLDLKKERILLLLATLFSIRFILYNFDMLQVTPIILWIILEAVYRAEKGQSLRAGFLLGIGVITKIMPIIIIPYWLYRNKYMAVTVAIAAVAISSLTPFLLLGHELGMQTYGDWLRTFSPDQAGFQVMQNRWTEGLHSLTAFIPAFFTEHSFIYPDFPSRTILPLSDRTASRIIMLSQILVSLVGAWLVLKTYTSAENNPDKSLISVGIICLVTVLIFPHQQKYAFLFLLPSTYYLLREQILRPSRLRISILVIVFLLTVVTTDGIVGKQLYYYSQYYKLITWGTLVLLLYSCHEILSLANRDTSRAPAG